MRSLSPQDRKVPVSASRLNHEVNVESSRKDLQATSKSELAHGAAALQHGPTNVVRQRQFSLHVDNNGAVSKRKGAGEPGVVNRAFLANQQAAAKAIAKGDEKDEDPLGALVISGAGGSSTTVGARAVNIGDSGVKENVSNESGLQGGFEAYVQITRAREETLYVQEGEMAVSEVLAPAGRQLLQGGAGLSLEPFGGS